MYLGSKLVGNLFVIISILYVLLNVDLIEYMFSPQGGNWDEGVAFFLIPFIILLLGTFLFKRTLKSGWALLLFYSLYAALNQIVFFLVNLEVIETKKIDLFMLLPTIPVAMNLIVGLIFLGMVVLLLKEEIRQDYSIKKEESLVVLIIAALTFGVLFIR